MNAGCNIRPRAVAAIVTYGVAVVLANILTTQFGMVPAGFGFTVTAGTFAAGLALLARDFVHRYAGWRWAVAAVVAGSIMSAIFADPAIALASVAAFAVAELVDLGVFAVIRRRGFVRAALTSNIISAPIDTIAFLAIAGFPLTVEAISGQFVGKILWATLLPLAVYGVARAVLREPIDAKGS